jgi:predicted nuclease with TOPRIM domain
MKQDFSNAVTVLESKLATTRSILLKEKATREEIQKRLEEIIQENAALMSTLKSREQELEKSLEGNKYTASLPFTDLFFVYISGYRTSVFYCS